MIIEHLRVSGLRNIDRLELCPDRGINWIVGPNGAGKTSILEAVFLLARGRSFRGHKYGPIQGRGRPFAEVEAAIGLGQQEGAPRRTIRLIQEGSAMRYFEDGRKLGGIRELRDRVQVRVLADNAQRLVEGEPRIRRLFLDWNLFHVEQDYARTLAAFRRALSQRNAWLRAGGHGPPIWDAAYCRHSEQIHTLRRTLVRHLHDYVRSAAYLCARLGDIRNIEYRRGWPEGQTLASLLRDTLKADIARGYTYYGPPRADFLLRLERHTALPSRGQAKLLVFYLQRAAQDFAESRNGARAVWLLDDLSAELDTDAAGRVLDELHQAGAQALVTAVGKRGSPPPIPETAGPLFHVEQGGLLAQAKTPAS